MSLFETCLAFTLKAEGGYNAADPSNHGVMQKVYDVWRDANKLPRNPVKEIADDEVKAIYLEEYWQKAGCDNLAWPLCLLHFDSSVNPGIGAARVFLDQTQGDPSLNYLDLRRDYYKGLAIRLPIYNQYLRGWLKRCDALEAAAKQPE